MDQLIKMSDILNIDLDKMLNNLDTDVYVITANKDSDVPNPMPEPLIRKITGNGEQLTQEELFNILKGE